MSQGAVAEALGGGYLLHGKTQQIRSVSNKCTMSCTVLAFTPNSYAVNASTPVAPWPSAHLGLCPCCLYRRCQHVYPAAGVWGGHQSGRRWCWCHAPHPGSIPGGRHHCKQSDTKTHPHSLCCLSMHHLSGCARRSSRAGLLWKEVSSITAGLTCSSCLAIHPHTSAAVPHVLAGSHPHHPAAPQQRARGQRRPPTPVGGYHPLWGDSLHGSSQGGAPGHHGGE